MSANEKKNSAFSGLEQVSTLVFRIPKEELKAYYLKETYLLESHACSVCMPYLIESSLTKEERKKLNLTLIDNLQAASEIQACKDVIGELTAIYNRHYGNVKYLLSQYPKSVTEE